MDNSAICTGNRDWSGELDRIDKVIDAVTAKKLVRLGLKTAAVLRLL